MNYAVIDINKGNILKLGENNRVLVALHGRHKLTEQELEKQYGPGVPTFKHIEWPVLTKLTGVKDVPRYSTCSAYFDISKCAVFAMGVEMI